MSQEIATKLVIENCSYKVYNDKDKVIQSGINIPFTLSTTSSTEFKDVDLSKIVSIKSKHATFIEILLFTIIIVLILTILGLYHDTNRLQSRYDILDEKAYKITDCFDAGICSDPTHKYLEIDLVKLSSYFIGIGENSKFLLFKTFFDDNEKPQLTSYILNSKLSSEQYDILNQVVDIAHSVSKTFKSFTDEIFTNKLLEKETKHYLIYGNNTHIPELFSNKLHWIIHEMDTLLFPITLYRSQFIETTYAYKVFHNMSVNYYEKHEMNKVYYTEQLIISEFDRFSFNNIMSFISEYSIILYYNILHEFQLKGGCVEECDKVAVAQRFEKLYTIWKQHILKFAIL